MVEPSSPELIITSSVPAPANSQAEPMETDTAAADNSAQPQCMQRKLVSKTYVNKEGYMGKCGIFCRPPKWTLLSVHGF